MSEQLPQQDFESPKLKVENLAAKTEAEVDIKSAEQQQSKAAESARKAISETAQAENQPNPLQRLEAAEKASQGPSPSYLNRELKQITLRRELKNLRRQLTLPQRALSHVVHQPAVRVASEAAGRTVGRPSGLLGGGFIALAGTSVYLYLAKHIGFEYNYGVFLALFVGGFALGLLIEALAALVLRRRPHD